MRPPALSVVVCTYRRPDRLGPLARAIAAQLRDDDELLFVDQTSGEGGEQGRRAVAAVPRARWLAHSPPGLPGARNRAVVETTRPVLLFFDDDVHLHPGCLEGHRSPYADLRVGGVTGRIVEKRLAPNAATLRNDVGWDGRVRTQLDVGRAGPIGSLKGANMSMRRAALRGAGPFEEALGGTALLEDTELSERLVRRGWRLWFAPGAAVDHDHDPVGGVRQEDAVATLRSRFWNTGFFVGRHRRRTALPGVWAVHAGVALRHGGPEAVPQLLVALREGWRAGRRTPWPRWDRS